MDIKKWRETNKAKIAALKKKIKEKNEMILRKYGKPVKRHTEPEKVECKVLPFVRKKK